MSLLVGIIIGVPSSHAYLNYRERQADQEQLLLPSQLPLRYGWDTRLIKNVLWDSLPYQTAIHLLEDSRPNEGALCLYGAVKRVIGGYSLVVRAAVTPEQIVMATPDSVRFNCVRDPTYIGTVHTHVNPDRMCIPSPRDLHQLYWDEQTLIEYIFCADDHVFLQMKHGFWQILKWRKP
jgi:hypothetical protein